jgi:hypothetical protein
MLRLSIRTLLTVFLEPVEGRVRESDDFNVFVFRSKVDTEKNNVLDGRACRIKTECFRRATGEMLWEWSYSFSLLCGTTHALIRIFLAPRKSHWLRVESARHLLVECVCL